MAIMNPNEKPIFQRKGTLNSVDMICCCINSAIGLGSLKMGAVFTSGIIVAYILLFIICILSYYSYKLLILTAESCHESTFEEIWTVSFSKKTVIIPVFFSAFSTLLGMLTYMREIQSSAITICIKIVQCGTNSSEILSSKLEIYKMLIGCIVFVFFLIPTCIVSHINTMSVISYISNFFFLIFIIYLIAMFGYEVKRIGFNTTHSFKLVQFNDNFTKSLSTAIFAFNFHPLTYPGLRHVKNSTKRNLLAIIKFSIFFILISYLIVGTFSYLTFFDKNLIGVVLDYYPENTNTEKILIIFGRILAFGFILPTIPFRLNSCRYVILNTINNGDSFPSDIWTFLGIIISLLALCLGNLTGKYLNVFLILSNIVTSLLLFILPPLFYLKTLGMSDKFYGTISILFLFIGVVTTVFMALNQRSY